MRLRPRSALAFIVLAPALVGCEHVTSIAAGASTDGGYSTGWTSMDAGAVANINAISGAGENAIVIVGDNGLAAVWDGTTLRRESTGTSVNLRGVWALDASHAFAVGDNGTILERKGTTWTRLDTTAALTAGLDAGAGDAGGAEAGATASALPVLTAVWADAQRVVAVGEKGVVLYRDAADFVRVPNKEVQNLLGVTGTAGGEIDAVGGLGVVFDVTATALTRRQIAGFTKDLAGATTTAAGSYFVGLEGSVVSYSGGGFTQLTGFPSTALRAVAAPGSDVWVVGFDGTIARYSGGAVTPVPSVDGRWLTGIYAPTPSVIWVVGRSGLIMRGPPPLAATDDAGSAADGGAP